MTTDERAARLTDTGDGGAPSHAPLDYSVPVVYPHVEGAEHEAVQAAIRAEGYEFRAALTAKSDPYSYSTLIRELWREGTGFLLVEQHALPPPGGLRAMQQCDALACNRPHDCRRRGVMGSLACAKFSRELVETLPDLADRVLARRRPKEWWRFGLLVNRPWFPGAAIPPGLDGACTDPEAERRLGPWPGPLWPTTQEWPHSDTVLWRALRLAGVEAHYHNRPSVCFPDPNEQRVE